MFGDNKLTCHSAIRSGFTLIELMVVISICTLLFALASPAMQSARETSRRIACQSNLRQLATAVTQHVNSYNYFPSNGGYLDGSTIKAKDGQLIKIMTKDFDAGVVYTWGVGKPATMATDQTGSWAYSILPYLDQVKAFQEVNVQLVQPLYLCPSRGRHAFAPTANDANGEYTSGGWAWAKADYCANARIATNLPIILHSAGITDGLSQTYLVGEKAYDPNVQRPTSWYWDEPIFSGGAKGTARAGLTILSDGPGIAFKENWGSAHRDGANFVCADASVHFISKSIGWEIMRSMLSPNNGEYEHYQDH